LEVGRRLDIGLREELARDPAPGAAHPLRRDPLLPRRVFLKAMMTDARSIKRAASCIDAICVQLLSFAYAPLLTRLSSEAWQQCCASSRDASRR
jgi:hypothetical protein